MAERDTAPASDPAAPAEFVALQREFAAHLRNPQRYPAPRDIEARRMRIYADLVYNNIEGFLSSGFPVLRKLCSDTQWQHLVRSFVEKHSARTPYFTRLAAEFVDYLAGASSPPVEGLPFLLELAQYEWSELALFLSDASCPDADGPAPDAASMLALHPCLSPLAWPMVFRFPVHEIGPGNLPQHPSPQPVCLVVYRNHCDEVGFLQLDAISARLLEIVEEGAGGATTGHCIEQLRQELPQMDSEEVMQGVTDILASVYDLDIIRFARGD